MRVRDVAFLGCKLLAILIVRQAIAPIALLIGATGAPARVVAQYLIEFVLFGGIGIALWSMAGSIAGSIAAQAGSPSDTTTPAASLRTIAVVGLALMGIWMLVIGVTSAVGTVGDYHGAGSQFIVAGLSRTVNPIRKSAEWRITAGLLEAVIGAVLLGYRNAIANKLTPGDSIPPSVS